MGVIISSLSGNRGLFQITGLVSRYIMYHSSINASLLRDVHHQNTVPPKDLKKGSRLYFLPSDWRAGFIRSAK